MSQRFTRLRNGKIRTGQVTDLRGRPTFKKRGLDTFRRFPKRRGHSMRWMFNHRKYGCGWIWSGYSLLRPLHVKCKKVRPFRK